MYIQLPTLNLIFLILINLFLYRDKTWISFEDPSSVDVKGKYARVRGLAGLALHKADKDTETPCGPTLRTSLSKVLNQQSRAPRAAVLRLVILYLRYIVKQSDRNNLPTYTSFS